MLARALKYILGLLLGLIILAGTAYIWKVNPIHNYTWEGTVYPERLSTNTLVLDSLQELYGNNKVLAPGYELQCLWALSAYPELKDIYIEFTLEPDGAPMESSFYIGSLLLGK